MAKKSLGLTFQQHDPKPQKNQTEKNGDYSGNSKS